ncbi:hypothetical protein [Zavarzinia compransoris]|uniref:hypothetical protein n=1 Tax=Zavarzinia compransoris TaxID=1264899 RepID=UPI001060171B|nr:hypothetical protein [Zavarzinia compransoris]
MIETSFAKGERSARDPARRSHEVQGQTELLSIDAGMRDFWAKAHNFAPQARNHCLSGAQYLDFSPVQMMI